MQKTIEDSVYWVDIEKIVPNPYQPRREFDEARLNDLAESIRQYGILQPLVVTRLESYKEDGLSVVYELIAGERRLRAAKIVGLPQVPVVVRTRTNNDFSDLDKLEIAIIENLQREDLNPVERARAFQRLAADFGLKHTEIARKVGKSREYVSNSLRLLLLPAHILDALSDGRIVEGHTRPLLMLDSRKEEQETLFKEIMFRKMSVREAELIARKIAYDKARKKEVALDPELMDLEHRLAESLGTRVIIERKENGGKITIDFYSREDLRTILKMVDEIPKGQPVSQFNQLVSQVDPSLMSAYSQGPRYDQNDLTKILDEIPSTKELLVDDRSKDEIKSAEEETDLYNVKNFGV